MTRNIALKLMYVGTAYHGWQVQKTRVTVAETLEKALATVVCHPVKCTGAGRTDAGVHAETYIANFRTASSIPCDRIPLAVNTRLPDDIVVVKATEVPEGFNAIGSCHQKGVHLPHLQLPHPQRLLCGPGLVLPQAPGRGGHAARRPTSFVGTHDFAAVRSVGTESRTTVRTVHYFQIARAGELIECRVCADGFLYNMVRAMVGTCVYAAEGKFPPEAVPASWRTETALPPALRSLPGGLYMTKLWYEEDVL